MSALKHIVEDEDSADANRRAVLHLLSEYQRARDERDAAATRIARFAETIRLLLPQLKSQDRLALEGKLSALERGHAPLRGGETFGKVVALFEKDRRPDWTIAQIQQALGAQIADQKALYNAINYLATSGRLRRIARGQYAIVQPGVGLEFEGEEDGTSRVSEHDL